MARSSLAVVPIVSPIKNQRLGLRKIKMHWHTSSKRKNGNTKAAGSQSAERDVLWYKVNNSLRHLSRDGGLKKETYLQVADVHIYIFWREKRLRVPWISDHGVYSENLISLCVTSRLREIAFRDISAEIKNSLAIQIQFSAIVNNSNSKDPDARDFAFTKFELCLNYICQLFDLQQTPECLGDF